MSIDYGGVRLESISISNSLYFIANYKTFIKVLLYIYIEMPSPRVLAAIGTILLVFSGVIPNFLVGLYQYLFGSISVGIISLISFAGFLVWISGNIINFFAWRGLAGGKDGLVGFLFIISALIHIKPFITFIYMLLIPMPFGMPPFEFILLAIYAVIAAGYIKVGYGLTRM